MLYAVLDMLCRAVHAAPRGPRGGLKAAFTTRRLLSVGRLGRTAQRPWGGAGSGRGPRCLPRRTSSVLWKALQRQKDEKLKEGGEGEGQGGGSRC